MLKLGNRRETAAELMENSRKRETAAAATTHSISREAAAVSRSSRILSQSSMFELSNREAMGMEDSWRDNIHCFGSSSSISNSSSIKQYVRPGKVRLQRGCLLKDNQEQTPRCWQPSSLTDLRTTEKFN